MGSLCGHGMGVWRRVGHEWICVSGRLTEVTVVTTRAFSFMLCFRNFEGICFVPAQRTTSFFFNGSKGGLILSAYIRPICKVNQKEI